VKHLRSGLFFIVFWTFLNRWLLWPLARLLALVSDRIRDQVGCRKDHASTVKKLASIRQQYRRCIVFFCSSAGEYEQARPVIETYSSDAATLCHVFFFSASGARFVAARKEDVSWSMSPVDDAERWHELFTALRPQKTIIVRHELWPSFLWAASFCGPVFVINAVVPSLLGRQSKWRERCNLLIKSWLFRFVDHVCVVSSADAEFFVRCLHIPEVRISVTGDTKYDRVVARAMAKKSAVGELRQRFQKLWDPPGRDQTLIGGSVHLPDVEWLLGVLSDASFKRLKLLLVPHDVSTLNIGRIYGAVKSLGVSVELLSEIENSKATARREHPRVLIVDEMGRLSEFYGLADVAWVGGAVHNKIHNVLEPAAWGLPVLCGPRYQNSQEAERMRERGVLCVVNAAGELPERLDRSLKNATQDGYRSLEFARSMAGATVKIRGFLDKASTEIIE
jgi:3-deoxy-D-manno-octulosonic-acid transferase